MNIKERAEKTKGGYSCGISLKDKEAPILANIMRSKL
jgi:hypothetical protein